MKLLHTFTPRWTYFFLAVIFLFGTFLRFYHINQVPVSLYWDETASAYNAYSISQTMHDEYGNFMPLLFRSFNDYKMSGNIYLMAFIVKAFGLNETTARASSAATGSLTILVTFFLVKTLFYDEEISLGFFEKKAIKTKYLPEIIALTTASLLAISPWHLQFSRTGFEANTGLFFVCFSALLFLKGLKRHNLFIISMILFGLSLYFYRSLYSFVPMLLIGLFIIYRKKIIHVKKSAIIGSFLFLIIALPITYQTFFSKGISRLEQVNIMNNQSNQDTLYQAVSVNAPLPLGRILFNNHLAKLNDFITGYLSHFSPEFLFLHGDQNGRHGPRSMGLLYLWELPFWFLGIFLVIHLPKRIRYFILLWFVIAPIPASISVPSPHALRSLNMVPITELFTSLGLIYVFQAIPMYRKIFFACVSVVIIFFFFQYMVLYYGYTAKITSSDWGDGYKQLTSYVFAHENSYDKVVISGHYWQPYIYFLFYKQYDPKLFQENGSWRGFDKYLFGGTSWDKDQSGWELGTRDLKAFAHANHILVALSPDEYDAQKNQVKKLTEIRNHNNELVFIVGEE